MRILTVNNFRLSCCRCRVVNWDSSKSNPIESKIFPHFMHHADDSVGSFHRSLLYLEFLHCVYTYNFHSAHLSPYLPLFRSLFLFFFLRPSDLCFAFHYIVLLFQSHSKRRRNEKVEEDSEKKTSPKAPNTRHIIRYLCVNCWRTVNKHSTCTIVTKDQINHVQCLLLAASFIPI